MNRGFSAQIIGSKTGITQRYTKSVCLMMGPPPQRSSVSRPVFPSCNRMVCRIDPLQNSVTASVLKVVREGASAVDILKM